MATANEGVGIVGERGRARGDLNGEDKGECETVTEGFDEEGEEVGVITASLTGAAVSVVNRAGMLSLVFSRELQSSSPRGRAHNL